MSFAGLKKQINKANQYMSEKIGGAKGTELDDEFVEMERKIDITAKLVEEIIQKTQDYLQPNPAFRVLNKINIRSQGKTTTYPQPEGLLGEAMIKGGKELGEESPFGMCLVEAGEVYKQIGDIKNSQEDNIRQNFLTPLGHLLNKDLKEVMHHRKKLQGRRLDYDCKKRKKEKVAVTEEDLRMAEEKFDESKSLAETAMYNVLENDVDQISQMAAFVEAQVDFHRQSQDVLQGLYEDLIRRREEAESRPRAEHVPKPIKRDLSPGRYNDNDSDAGSSYGISPMHTPTHQPAHDLTKPCCRALYDFDPENEGELGFAEGDIIKLKMQIDENWFEGENNGVTGYFPVNYVDVLVNLP